MKRVRDLKWHEYIHPAHLVLVPLLIAVVALLMCQKENADIVRVDCTGVDYDRHWDTTEEATDAE